MGGGTSSESGGISMPPHPPMTPEEQKEFEKDEAYITEDYKSYAKEFKGFLDSLENTDRNIIKQFLGEQVEEVNLALKGLPEKMSFTSKRAVTALDRLFKEFPATKTPFNTFRGLKGLQGFGLSTSAKKELLSFINSGDIDSVTKFSEKYLIGGNVHTTGYSKTSTSRKDVEKLVANRGALIRIKVPKGARGIPFSRKYLLNRGSTYKVRSVSLGSNSAGNYLILDVDLK